MISRQCSFGKRTDTEINVTEYTQETDRDVTVIQWKKNSLSTEDAGKTGYSLSGTLYKT